jgi:hypothetical protein
MRASYSFASPNTGDEAVNERAAATRIASHVPVERPQLAFVNASAARRSTRWIAWRRSRTTPGTLTYPNNGLALALRTVAGSIVRGLGTRVYWVQTGGFDTHAGQGANGGGAYATLMSTFNDSVRCLLQRPAQSRPARRHDDSAVLRVQPAHLEKRQQRDGPRRAPAS